MISLLDFSNLPPHEAPSGVSGLTAKRATFAPNVAAAASHTGHGASDPRPRILLDCLENTLLFTGRDLPPCRLAMIAPTSGQTAGRNRMQQATSPCRGGIFGRRWISLRTVTNAEERPITNIRSRTTMANKGQPNQGLDAIVTAAGEAARRGPPPVHLWNSAVLRRSRPADRPRWHLVLPENPDRTAIAGQIVCFGAQAGGGQIFSGHPGRKSRHRRRGRAVPRGRTADWSSLIPPIPRPEHCIFERTSMTGSPAVQATRSASSRSLKPEA